jgi:hypothetical protein
LEGINFKALWHESSRLLSQFDKVSLFHIRRALNKEADAWEKLVTSMSQGALCKMGNLIMPQSLIIFLVEVNY